MHTIRISFLFALLLTMLSASAQTHNVKRGSGTSTSKPSTSTTTKKTTTPSTTKNTGAISPQTHNSKQNRRQTSSSSRVPLNPVIQNLINNMVYVEGGTFMMGATSEQGSSASDWEKPIHQVTVSSFSIGRYEVTQEGKMMVDNEKVDCEVRKQLSLIYPKNDVKQLARKVSEWFSAEFGINILGYGGNLKTSRNILSPNKSIDWIDKVNILEDIINNYCDDSKYYIIFDELDEDYRDVSNQNESTQYKSLLTSLFKAVQDVKSTFLETTHNIRPIVFLRDDIYGLVPTKTNGAI